MTELELNLSFHCCQFPRPPHRHMMGKWKMQVCVCVCVCVGVRLLFHSALCPKRKILNNLV